MHPQQELSGPMAQEKSRQREGGGAQPILLDERAADEWRRSAEHDRTETTGDELGVGVNEEPAPDATEATGDAQLLPETEDVPWEELSEIE
jgi:hypothetical protein